jgi:Pentapeptide repeats (8 copies)
MPVRAPDIQAIMTVLGRRTPSPPHPEAWITLDLARTDLRYAGMNGANLYRARLRGASLAKAWLFKAGLRKAVLREAIADLTTWWPDEHLDPKEHDVRVLPNLEGADLRSAYLKERISPGSACGGRERTPSPNGAARPGKG